MTDPVEPPRSFTPKAGRAAKHMRPDPPMIELQAAAVEENIPVENNSLPKVDGASSEENLGASPESASALAGGAPASRTRQRVVHMAQLAGSAVIGGTIAAAFFLSFQRSPDIRTWESRLTAAESALRKISTTAPVSADVNLAPRLETLEGKFTQEEQHSKAALAPLTQRMDEAERKLQALSGQLATPPAVSSADDLKRLDDQVAGTIRENKQQAALNRAGYVLLDMERALLAGKPYAAQLERIRPLMPQANLSKLSELARYADAGIPPMEQLAEQLRRQVNAALLMPPPAKPQPQGVWASLWNSAKSVVRVTPVVPPEGASPERVRLIALLNAKEWSGVVEQQKKLDNAAWEATRGTAAQIHARLNAELALTSLHTTLFAGAASPSSPGEEQP
jgi:hypothetical protein